MHDWKTAVVASRDGYLSFLQLTDAVGLVPVLDARSLKSHPHPPSIPPPACDARQTCRTPPATPPHLPTGQEGRALRTLPTRHLNSPQ
jgi:hypothetical protein